MTRNQGGCVASIRPEYLMEPSDYKQWKWLKEVSEAGGDIAVVSAARGVPTEEEVVASDALFNALSKRSWTDILLQVIFCSLFVCRLHYNNQQLNSDFHSV